MKYGVFGSEGARMVVRMNAGSESVRVTWLNLALNELVTARVN